MPPLPKPAHLRQRKNKKPGYATLEAPIAPEIPEIPNPDGRKWHPLTLAAWERAWCSPMASQWLDTDEDALGRLAVLWDDFYKSPKSYVMAEIRMQEQRFGFSPLDRTRLQWEIRRAEEPVKRRQPTKRTGADPREVLRAIS